MSDSWETSVIFIVLSSPVLILWKVVDDNVPLPQSGSTQASLMDVGEDIAGNLGSSLSRRFGTFSPFDSRTKQFLVHWNSILIILEEEKDNIYYFQGQDFSTKEAREEAMAADSIAFQEVLKTRVVINDPIDGKPVRQFPAFPWTTCWRHANAFGPICSFTLIFPGKN